MANAKKLWVWLGCIFFISFGILGLIGRDIYVKAPPVPDRVVTSAGTAIGVAVLIEAIKHKLGMR